MRRSILASVTLLASAQVFAQAGGTGVVPPPFAEVDTDGSGTLSFEEVVPVLRGNAPHQQLFDRWDENDDGAISKEEWPGEANSAG